MASKDEIVVKAREVAEPLLLQEGLELVDVEWGRDGSSWVLRVFIDKPGARVGLDDCTTATRAIETALDVEDFIPQAYSLEVSSPGVNRPLVKPQHFEKALNQKVKIKTFGPLGTPPRKQFTGKLVAFAEATATVDVEGAGQFRIPLKDIAKANLEYDFDQDL
jgi:ribosome maturation factor RimP